MFLIYELFPLWLAKRYPFYARATERTKFIETCKISEYNFIENNKLLQHINFVQGMVKL
jgi:hypothetical protein